MAAFIGALARAAVSVLVAGPGWHLTEEAASAAAANSRPCRADLAQSLARTGTARQVVTAEGSSYESTVASVALWAKSAGCWSLEAGPWKGFVGANGFSDHHREGDGTTPTGTYAIGRTVYGNAPDPGVHTTYRRLACGDWWDEDPSSPQYNTFEFVPCGRRPPFGRASEALWTETAAYPSFAVVEYNMHPVVPFAGSAIFIHASIGTPTTGCVSVPLDDLDTLLRALDWSLHPVIVMGPASEIDRF